MWRSARSIILFVCLLWDKIKSKSPLKARTVLHVRDKCHACYWYPLSMFLLSLRYLSAANSAGYLHRVQIKPFIVKIFTNKKHSTHRNWVLQQSTWISFVRDILQQSTWISFVRDINKQTCLGQGFGVTITSRKGPSKLMFTMKDFVGHLLVRQN